jgi:hypothetical protein
MLMLTLMSVGCLIGIAVPAGLGWDFANFYDAGRMVAAGEAELLLKPVKGMIAGTPPQGVLDFWGTPISAWLYVPLAAFEPATALVLFKLENVLAYSAALLLLFFHLRDFSPAGTLQRWRFTLLYAGAVLLYQPFWTVFRVGGQTTATVFLLLVGGLILHRQLRFGGSALLFVAAVMIKPALVTALLFLVLVSGKRFAGYTLLYLALMGILSVAVMGWDIQMEFVDKMLGGSGMISRWTFNSSLYVFAGELQHWFEAHHEGQYPRLLISTLILSIKLGVVAMFAWVVWRTRREFTSHAARAYWNYLLAIVFFLLVSQTIWEHYLALLFIPLALLLARHNELDRTQRWMVPVLFVALPLQNLIVILLLQDWFAFDTLPALLPVLVLKTAPLWLALLLIAGQRQRLAAICQEMAPDNPEKDRIP